MDFLVDDYTTRQTRNCHLIFEQNQPKSTAMIECLVVVTTKTLRVPKTSEPANPVCCLREVGSVHFLLTRPFRGPKQPKV